MVLLCLRPFCPLTSSLDIWSVALILKSVRACALYPASKPRFPAGEDWAPAVVVVLVLGPQDLREVTGAQGHTLYHFTPRIQLFICSSTPPIIPLKY